MSKIPVFQRSDKIKLLTPLKGNDTVDLPKTPNNEICANNKKDPNSSTKYKHVTSKISTHWSPEERQRTGLRTFFERKERTSTFTNPMSPENIMKHISRAKSIRRQSLPAQFTTNDPIGLAIENIRKTPMLQSYSSCSSSNSSFMSLPENCSDIHQSE